MKKKIEQKPVSEIVPAMMEAINATGAFLDMLKQIAKYTYRRNIKMSDEELEQHIETQIINMLQANREYYLMHHFIIRENLWPRWEMFRAECQNEVVRIAPPEEKDDEATDK